MAGTSLGSAYVQIVPSAQGISGSISKVLNSEAGGAGSSAGMTIASKIKGAIVAAGIGAAVTAGIKSSLLEGAELEQNIGGTKAVFGNFYSDIQESAKSAYKNMGLSASDYMATANKMGSLFQGSGLSQKRSLDLTSDAMQRAADVASVMGIDTSFAMESIAGAAKGNFTMMDNLGVAMNATTLQAYALEKGVNFDWNTASNAEKAELAMQMFMDRTSQYEGNFARESEETFSGSLGAMKAAAQDFAGNLSLGENVQPALQNLITTTSTFLFNNLIPALGNIFKALPGAISTFIQTGLPQFISAGKGLVTSLAEGAKNELPGMIKNLMTGLVSLSGSLRSGMSKFVDVGLALIKNVALGIIKNIPTFIQTVPKIITNIAGIINDNAPKIIATGVSIIKALIKGLIKAIPVLVENIPQIIKAIFAVFQAVSWVNIGKLVSSGIAKGAKAAIGKIKGAMNSVKSSITGKIEEARTAVASVVDKIRSKLSFSGLAGKAKSAFDSVKSKITGPIKDAKDTVSKAIKKIDGLFPLNVGKIMSNIRVPKINISKGEAPYGLGGKGTKPSISVTWNKKAMENPYLFSNPTLFGAGEAGDEVLYGRKRLLSDITEAVDRAGSSSGDIVVNLNYDASDDAADMLRDLTRGVRRYRMAGVF